MKIVRNQDFSVQTNPNVPIYYVLDDNGNIIFNGVTEDECALYIEDNKNSI